MPPSREEHRQFLAVRSQVAARSTLRSESDLLDDCRSRMWFVTSGTGPMALGGGPGLRLLESVPGAARSLRERADIHEASIIALRCALIWWHFPRVVDIRIRNG